MRMQNLNFVALPVPEIIGASRADGRTDGQTTCDRNTALCTKVHRAVKTIQPLASPGFGARGTKLRENNISVTHKNCKFYYEKYNRHCSFIEVTYMQLCKHDVLFVYI